MIRLTYKEYLGIALVLAVIGVLGVLWQRPWQAYGAVDNQSSGYYATSTRNFAGTAIAGLTTLKAGPGIFGSLVITGAGAGTINFFDATTSNVNLRTGNAATSTILIASFPVSTAAGTYTIDATLNSGLLMEVIGTAPTSTPTWK